MLTVLKGVPEGAPFFRYTRRVLAKASLKIAFKSVDHPLFPEQKNVDRISGTSGKWILTKKTKGIQVEYFITTTPSKILPAWVTDPIIINNFLSTMKEFREILEK